VAPLGLSGRYGLPERGFREAIEAGVNLFFWEPDYHTQTTCWQRLVPSLKERLTVVAGSFAAEPRAVRRDLEEALQLLRMDRIDVFLLFWVRSPRRLSEETLEALEDARQAGLVRTLGLSTHLRPLAADAVRAGWPVLMVRHSLAHRGAEDEVLPLARTAGAGIITFSNLCYGRLSEGRGPSPVDCYRYSLSQPGVSACLSAPRNLEQLRYNLQVLEKPVLDADTLAALRPWGDAVYRRHRAFVEWLRSR
jgi:aryl-alcohol dehydrogenase-like predicted oxidoreductase